MSTFTTLAEMVEDLFAQVSDREVFGSLWGQAATSATSLDGREVVLSFGDRGSMTIPFADFFRLAH